jgi:hypothetical protein
MMHRVKPLTDRPRRDEKSVEGKRLLLGVLVALIVAVGLVFYSGVTGGSTHTPLSKPGVGFTTDPAAASAAGTSAAQATVGGGAIRDAAITNDR